MKGTWVGSLWDTNEFGSLLTNSVYCVPGSYNWLLSHRVWNCKQWNYEVARLWANICECETGMLPTWTQWQMTIISVSWTNSLKNKRKGKFILGYNKLIKIKMRKNMVLWFWQVTKIIRVVVAVQTYLAFINQWRGHTENSDITGSLLCLTTIMSFSTATPLCMWAISWMGYINMIRELTESDKL